MEGNGKSSSKEQKGGKSIKDAKNSELEKHGREINNKKTKKKTVEKEEGFKEDTALDLTKKVEANKCYQNKESHKAIKKNNLKPLVQYINFERDSNCF